ncbi:MAG TPA: M1 family metallopeptidase [Candidatus Saccharimonadales bacterium]
MQTVTRLFKTFQPNTYSLNITIHRVARTFEGEVEITGTLTKAQSFIPLHAKHLIITHAAVDEQEAAAEIHENDEVQIATTNQLATGTHTLKLAFNGAITDPMHGLYPCYYEHCGAKKELLATQFESHHAREAFPCIDEPEAKATFSLTLVTETGVEVLGNMPVASQQTTGETLITTFETSPKMSTYLLAFVIGELQHKEATTKDGVIVRTWATPAQPIESLAFSLDTAVKTIEFFNDYFGVKYPLPKSDHVALPDFSSGAMENWGLITYRETTLLADPEHTSVSSRHYIATVVTHELSHQWFGNLVTMKWWNDLWLNESFASLMEVIALDHLRPEWNASLDFAAHDTVVALRRDVLTSVQAIKTEVHHPDEISTLFDPAIVYAKGANVLNMLRAYIGDTAFRDGLRVYFARHRYANTTGDDLWAAFEEASHKNVKEFMYAWLEKPGYPLVSINQQGAHLELEQKRLLLNGKDTTSLWPIPLLAEPPFAVELLSKHTTALTAATDTPRLFNKGGKSLFVSRYTQKSHRDFIRSQIKAKAYEPVDRLRLLNEGTLLARAGEQRLAEVLDLMSGYENEDRDAVWDMISLVIADTRRFVEHDPAAEAGLKQLVLKLIKKNYGELGHTFSATDSEEVIKLRATIFSLAVWAEHPAALEFALSEFHRFKDPGDLPAEIRSIIYGAGARWRGEEAYDKLMTLYKQTTFAEERHNIAGGMSATRNLDVVHKLLAHMTDTSIVRLQDTAFWFVYLARKNDAREFAWQWLVDNWGWLMQQFGSDKSLDYFPRYAASAFTGKGWLEKYEAFFTPKKTDPALRRAIEIGIEEIISRTVWFERDEPSLRQYLTEKQ